MRHDEYIFLLARAQIVYDASHRARAEGEIFHALRTYTPLASGLSAHCERDETRVTLYLRHREPIVTGQLVDEAFRVFFEKGCDRSPPKHEGGWVTYTGSALLTDVKNPITSEPRHDSAATSGRPMAARDRDVSHDTADRT